jgi:hypothetical protein
LNYVNTVTHVLVPTVLRLIEKLNPGPLKSNLIEPEQKLETEPENSTVEQAETPHEESMEKIVAEPPANQFLVEEMKGLFSPSDTVRIDNSVIEKWNEFYQDKTIEEADVETFGGKSVRCKVKPIKNAKLEGQGKVQIPGKMQLVLDIKKGELVRVKPVVE